MQNSVHFKFIAKSILGLKFRLLLQTASLQLLFIFTGNALAENPEKIWQTLQQENHFALLRHALAPGTGDPANFDLADCATQRNLSESGKAQAMNIGQALRKHGVSEALVYSSQWCRCMETARLLGFEKVAEMPYLNSFFRNFQRKEPQTKALKEWLLSQPLTTPTILVTHQVNITALTGIFPSSGELIVVRLTSGQFEYVGSVTTPY